jgi:hypothetical protein
MQREVTDGEGTKWVCVQAYAGLTGDGGDKEAARVDGEGDLFEVVCTPSGGAQTVRLQLAGGWENDRTDEELLREIESRR